MTNKILAMVLCVVLAIPCALCASETEILLVEVVEMGTIEGDIPLDGPEQSGNNPTRPRDFRATIDGTTLTVSKQEAMIPSAQAVVVNASTGAVVANQEFTTSFTDNITFSGIYVLRIHTAGGDLVGQFIVQ